MSYDPIPEKVQRFWDSWNIRTFIILSLVLQIILTFLAPLRKATSNTFVIFLVWSAYLLADWAAIFAFGLITNGQQCGSGSGDSTGDLQAFWAPFLLLHLGGPDTITAFAMEDNELWLRHLLGLVYLFIPALYVLLRTLPNNRLLIPTVLMFVAGLIRYSERSMSLFLASLDKIKESVLKKPIKGPNYEMLMGPDLIDNLANMTMRIVEKDILNEQNPAKTAYRFIGLFKGLFVDLMFSKRDQDETRMFLKGRNSYYVYDLILTELNFMYETLYTKFTVVYSCIIRLIASGFTVAALALFTKLTKSGFHRFDVRATYVLLISAVILDLIAMLMLLFSEATVANIKILAERHKSVGGFVDCSLTPIIRIFLDRKRPRLSRIDSYSSFDTPFIFRRWAESISAYNLIGYCLKEKPQKFCKPMGRFNLMVHIVITSPFLIIMKLLQYLKLGLVKLGPCCCPQFAFVIPLVTNFIWNRVVPVLDVFGMIKIFAEMGYVSKNGFPEPLWNAILGELLLNSYSFDDRDWALHSSLRFSQAKDSLMPFVRDVEYDESILIWHIATDICYYTTEEKVDEAAKDFRLFSKLLSDYMLYLLVLQPKMMSPVAGIAQIRFRDTCAATKKFFNCRDLGSVKSGEGKLKQACRILLEDDTDIVHIRKGIDENKSILYDACVLAKELKKLDDIPMMNKWQVILRVWIDLLFYVARRSRPDTHAQSLGKGGELLTLVWLLGAQIGLIQTS